MELLHAVDFARNKEIIPRLLELAAQYDRLFVVEVSAFDALVRTLPMDGDTWMRCALTALQHGNCEVLVATLENFNGTEDMQQLVQASCRYGDRRCMKALMWEGISFPASSLTIACKYGHLEMVNFLLDRGFRDDADNTAFLWSCRSGHAEIAELLVNRSQVDDVNVGDGLALRYACINGHNGIVQVLLRVGAVQHWHGHHALYCSIRNGYTDVVDTLVRADTSLDLNTLALYDIDTDESCSAIALCLHMNDVLMLEYLLGIGCCVPAHIRALVTDEHEEMVAVLQRFGHD